MKKTYTTPEVEITVFKSEDIITTSLVTTKTQTDIPTVGNIINF